MNAGNNTLEYSRALQEKFELYALGLLFTLLAAAVQTAKFGANHIADSLELVSWILLLFSGLVGLQRMEWIPVAHSLFGEKQNAIDERARTVAAEAAGTREVFFSDSGERHPIDAVISRQVNVVNVLSKKANDLNQVTRRRWALHKWTFVAGLCTLIAGRGFVPTASLWASAFVSAPSIAPAAAASPASSPMPVATPALPRK